MGIESFATLSDDEAEPIDNPQYFRSAEKDLKRTQRRVSRRVKGSKGRAMFGGDACGEIWARILELSDDETLEWDIFLAPHHCSWSFFNAVPYEENKQMQQASLDALGKRRAGAIIVASSKPIEDMEPSQRRSNVGKWRSMSSAPSGIL